METIDIIKELCKKKGLTVTQLENELDYGNGSLAKSKSMSAERMYQISKYFGVSMEYLMTGKTIEETDDQMALLRQQQSILMEINKINQQMSDAYKKINEYQDQLSSLKKEYNRLSSGTKSESATKTLKELPDDWHNLFEDELPFN